MPYDIDIAEPANAPDTFTENDPRPQDSMSGFLRTEMGQKGQNVPSPTCDDGTLEGTEDGHGPSSLSVKRETVLNALLLGSSITEAAEKAGVNRKTVYRWMSTLPEFTTQLQAQRQQRWNCVETTLADLHSAAIAQLQRAMTDEKTPLAARLRAADTVLRHLRPRNA